jgi:hypothetical protein
MANAVDLHKLFLNLQQQMIQDLTTHQEVGVHAGSKGTAAETRWREMLQNYLPKRYSVANAFVLDSLGQASDQIDIVIYDRQYSPFLFNENDHIYVPAESVYAIFEVKPTINAAHVKYAGGKAASVRSLLRTSARIPHAGGTFESKPLHDIIAGVLCLDCEWQDKNYEAALKEHVGQLTSEQYQDLGCVLKGRSFEARSGLFGVEVMVSKPESSLIFFFLNLLTRLQACGTVPAADWNIYGKSL